MKRATQNLLLLVYRTAVRTGLLSTRLGHDLFGRAYAFYKRHLEAGNIELLRPLVGPGTSILDVGANIGELTLRFARWVTEGGRVYAFEPEPANFRQLAARLDGAGLAGRGQIVQAAVADSNGELRLKINRDHPGDHRLGEHGIPVRAVTLDSFVEQLDGPQISLIKIDVQGAEEKVLDGARRTLERQRPALFLEVDADCLRRFASNPRKLLEKATDSGYEIRRLLRRSLSRPMRLETALELQATEGYLDLLLVPAAPRGGGRAADC